MSHIKNVGVDPVEDEEEEGEEEEEEGQKEEKWKYRLWEYWPTCLFQVNQNEDKEYSHSAFDWQISLWKWFHARYRAHTHEYGPISINPAM